MVISAAEAYSAIWDNDTTINNINSGWAPLIPEYYHLDHIPDIFHEVRDLVKYRNESWDILIFAPRGSSKSTVGLSLAYHIDPDYSLYNWAFKMEDRLRLETELPPGSVLVSDEMGTQLSGSSHEYQKKENKELADQVQLNRTNRIIHIDITLDPGRILNRVRATYALLVFPLRKLSDKETGGRGLATECIVRTVQMIPFSNNSDPFQRKYWRYTDGGRISRFVLFHPPADIWKQYSKMRNDFQEELNKIEDAKKARQRKFSDTPDNLDLRRKIYSDY